MKYYFMMTNGGSIKCKKLSLMPVQSNLIDYFDTNKVNLEEPVLLQAFYYHEDDREEDFVCAGNPQVVSENFKRLVEDLDPNAAQFFSTTIKDIKTQKKYYVMHVTQTIACLDREHSTIWPDCLGIKKEDIVIEYIDKEKVPSGVHLFRMAEDTANLFVSEKFLKEYRKRKIRGCIFRLRTAEPPKETTK